MPPVNLPPPKVLVVDDNVATNWKAWKKVWSRYEIATGISKQEKLVRVSTLLSVIGEDATKAFNAFEWGEDEDETEIEHVLTKFDEYCEPQDRGSTKAIGLIIASKSLARVSQPTSQI